MLLREFNRNTEWSKDQITNLSRLTGLSEGQVYKWNWDQRKKFKENTVFDFGHNSSLMARDLNKAYAYHNSDSSSQPVDVR